MPSPAASNKIAVTDTEPLPAGLPHVAYVLLWYPLFTQPFIFREVENLRKILPLQTYTLYDQNMRYCSREMVEHSQRPVSFGMKSFFDIFWQVGVAFFKNPRKVFSLFKKSCLRPWKSLEIFGENFWAFGVGICLASRFKEDGIDFVYAPWPRGATTAARVAASMCGLPYAFSVRGDNLAPADPDLGDKLNDAVLIRANNKADQKRIQNFDNGQGSNKVVLVYNSLTFPRSDNHAEKNSGDDLLRILAVGRFDVTKGFDVLLRACEILKKEKVPFSLTLAGGGGKFMGIGNLEKELRRLRKDLNLENEVEMPGLLSHDDLPAAMKSHDIFVAPCIIHKSGRRDGIPNTVIEAMSLEMPVIATTVNALPEVIINGETGLSIEPDNPDALAEAILWMKNNPDDARAYGKNASSLARRMFDPASNARKLADALIAAARKPSCAG